MAQAVLLVVFICLQVFTSMSLAVASSNNFTNSGQIRINCGASGLVTDRDGRTWDGDESKFPPSLKSTDISSTEDNLVPFATTHIFMSNYTYVFPVWSGRIFVRLYFYLFQTENLETDNALFSVTAGSLILLRNFSTSQNAKVVKSARLVREFSLNITSGSLNITFAPHVHQKSFAFVNGIELVPTPDIFTTPMPTFVSGKEPYPLPISSNTSFQTMYRLNVGGATISAGNDSGFYRSWQADYFYTSRGVFFSKDSNLTIKYPLNFPNYITPMDLYATARSMGPNRTINENYNLSWILPVDGGFHYLVRLHFCEIQYPFTKVNQRVFFIYLNNQSVQQRMDGIRWSGGIGMPVYTDYIVTTNNSGQTDLWVSLQPDLSRQSKYSDAILNGLEVFKFTDNNKNDLSGLSPPFPLNPDVDPNRPSSAARKSKGDMLAAIGGTIGGFALMLIVLFSMCVIWRRRKVAKNSCNTDYGHQNRRTERRKPTCDMFRHFSFAEIQLATKDFDEAFIIGRGGFGNVYRGKIDGGTKVAIKRSNQKSQQGFHEFQTEIEMLCNFRHRHLVSLIGYCEEKNEMILVYDYMAHGTLREHLYNTRNPPLLWQQRLEICIGAARGLHYLHTGAEHGIIHRDVKTTNILLDDKLVAKVSDFGLSKASPDIENTHMSTAVKGTFGYLDPEYFRLQRLTKKSDVYSFGVVLFETLCARPVINTLLPEEQVSLRDWALSCRKKGVLKEITDPRVKEEITPECFRVFAGIAEQCVADRSIDRPSMGDVLWNLEVALQLQGSATNNGSCARGASSLQINEVHADKPSTHSTISVAAQGDIFSDIVHPEGR